MSIGHVLIEALFICAGLLGAYCVIDYIRARRRSIQERR